LKEKHDLYASGMAGYIVESKPALKSDVHHKGWTVYAFYDGIWANSALFVN